MDLTTEAVRLGLRMSHLRVEVASENIAGMNVAGARQKHVDFSAVIDALHEAEGPGADPHTLAAMDRGALVSTVVDRPEPSRVEPSLDAEVADLTMASTDFQALSDALSRRFAMLELATTGKG